MKTFFRLTMLIAGAALLFCAGCAPTQVSVVSTYTGPLPQPNQIMVYNFAVSPDDVTLDQGISADVEALVKGSRTPRTDQELQIGRAVADALSKKLVEQINALGYSAYRASGPLPGPGNVIVIQGQICSIDEGSRTERVVIGLGVGRSDVKTMTQVYDIQPHGRRLVEQFQTDAKSGYKPGMAETEGASIAAGHWATGLAVGAGINVASEMFGANVEADADRTAKDIAKQLNAYFISKGWVPPNPPSNKGF